MSGESENRPFIIAAVMPAFRATPGSASRYEVPMHRPITCRVGRVWGLAAVGLRDSAFHKWVGVQSSQHLGEAVAFIASSQQRGQ